MPPSDHLLRSAAIAPEIQPALMAEYPGAMAFNEHLCMEALQIVSDPRKLPAAAAKALLGRPVPVDRLRAWATKERRATPLRALMEANPGHVDDELVDMLGKATPEVLGAAINSEGVSAAKALETLARVDPESRLSWLASVPPSAVSDADVIAQMAEFASWADDIKARARRSAACALLVAVRPGVIDALLTHSQHDSLVVAIAGSASLVDEAAQHRVLDLCVAAPYRYDFAVVALAANPTVHQSVRERIATLTTAQVGASRLDDAKHFARRNKPRQDVPVADVGDREVLRDLLRRALPTEHKHQGRPALAWQLCFNDNLEETECMELAKLVGFCAFGARPRALPRWAGDEAAEHVTARFAAAASVFTDARPTVWAAPEREHLGDPADLGADVQRLGWPVAPLADAVAEALGADVMAWRVALSLVDSFTGTCAELVTVARATAA
jgi:hypothetical protein